MAALIGALDTYTSRQIGENGNIEYKFMINSTTRERLDQLTTQMKWRMQEDQLESEMEHNSWIVTTNSYENKIIGKSTIHFWKEKIIELGGDYLIWSNAPENPYMN